MDKIGKPFYGIVNSGIFGAQIISGIITGIRFTEDKPIYEISFGKSNWQTSVITDNQEELFKLLNLAPLRRIKETHGLKIKFGE